MNGTFNKGTVNTMSPDAEKLAIGGSMRVSVRSSMSQTGYVVVNIKRMTDEYFFVSQLHNTGAAL